MFAATKIKKMESTNVLLGGSKLPLPERNHAKFFSHTSDMALLFNNGCKIPGYLAGRKFLFDPDTVLKAQVCKPIRIING